MGAPFKHLLDNSQSEPHPAGYTSNTLPLFLEGLEQVRASQILDVGLICGDNIRFFTQRVKRLYICNMFLFLKRDARGFLSPNQVRKYLDYPPRSLDGILLWNLIDYLNDSQVARIATLFSGILKPGGMIFISLTGKRIAETVPCSFVVKDRFHLDLNPKPEIDLSLNIRSNREVLELLSLFTPEKSFLYQNGVREYLLRNN